MQPWHAPEPPTPTPEPHAQDTRKRFDAAVVMLHARRYEEAATALHRVLAYAPKLPEAHVNMGFALLGLARLKEAHDFFEGATALAPTQANAYYGLALATRRAATLPRPPAPCAPTCTWRATSVDEHLARARAALWEWETRLQAARAGAPASAAGR
jgi:tetratricopeptide (TPR) repeat protein